jgi:hypothetical protein
MPINPMAKARPRKPAGLPPPVQQEQEPEPSLAYQAVQRYEELRRQLEDMKAAFETNHPEAVSELEAIRQMEDTVQEAIATAKAEVASAKESIGEFSCKRRFSSAHYDPARVTEILGALDNAGEVYVNLYRTGVIKSIDFDKNRLVTRISQDPAYSETFKEAWREKSELTPSVSVPKL